MRHQLFLIHILLPLLLLAVSCERESLEDELGEWNNRVYYQIFVRSFYDSDGDGIGDIRGIIEKLDYLNDGDPVSNTDLGVTGIWLMPIHESPSYHGYDVTDYYSIHSDYGSLDDFRDLIAEAKERGIEVIMDLVLNHSSSQHPWFLSARRGDSRYTDYYVWTDEDPGTVGPWGQQVWHNRSHDRYYYGVFWSEMPDLNYWNPDVDAEMRNVARFWLDDMGVSGFRLDAIMYLKEEMDVFKNSPSNYEWLQSFHSYVRKIKPELFIIGEAWTGSAQAVKYVDNGVDATFEFDLATAMLNAVRRRSGSSLQRKQEELLTLYPAGQYGRFLTNHDQTRTASVLGTDRERQKLAAALLLTGPGIPFIYYGEEVGIEGTKPDENLRRPMHWQPDGGFSGKSGKRVQPWQDYADNVQTNNVASMVDDAASLWNRYRALIWLRNGSPALRRGQLMHVSASTSSIYAFLLHSSKETLLVVHNLGGEQNDYGLSVDEIPVTGNIRMELLYVATTQGNFFADSSADGQVNVTELIEFTDPTVSVNLDSPAMRLIQPALNENNSFENYSPLSLLLEKASYVFRITQESF